MTQSGAGEVGPRVVDVAAATRLFGAVQRLRTRESATLGQMPSGAFEEAAAAGGLIAAVDAAGELSGYVLFRRTQRGHATIAHLCVARECRRQGVARRLFAAVRERCASCSDIRVSCRRDFIDASRTWEGLGFSPVAERRGRAGILTIWRHELSPLPIFQRLALLERDDAVVRLVLDANVFFRMDPENAAGDDLCRALDADWLSDYVELALTAEMLVEINRHQVGEHRERQRGRYEQFVHLLRSPDRHEEERLFEEIRARLGQPRSESADSDARQLALTISAGAAYFITRDGVLRAAADELEQAYGVEILLPDEVILRFDRLHREEAYRPRRLHLGPGTRSVLAGEGDVERLAEIHHAGHSAPEPRTRTRARLREMLVQPNRFEAACIEQGEALLVTYILERSDASTLDVPFLAAANTQLGGTAIRHYAESLVARAVREARSVVRVTRPGRRVAEALSELGFLRDGEDLIKLCSRVEAPASVVAGTLEHQAARGGPAARLVPEIATALRSSALGRPREHSAMMERLLWPAKVLEADLPSFIVPIKPEWAKDLFDTGLAEGTLFGAQASLIMSSENVYFRAATPRIPSAPSRVLWYVSQSKHYPDAKRVRACSQVEEVVVGEAKQLFGRFRTRGVYQWPDVLELARGNERAPIMAFRFSRTELFPRPVSWDDLQDILEDTNGARNQIASPVSISEEAFVRIYRCGTRPDA